MLNLNECLFESPLEQTVCTQQRDVVTWQAFRQQVALWQSSLALIPQKKIILFSQDSCTFAAALLAIWHSGKTAVIPGDNLPGTLNQISHLSEVGIGEFPSNSIINTLKFAEQASPDLPANNLDSNHPAVIVFTSGSSGEPKAICKRLKQLNNEVQSLEKLWGHQATNSQVIASVSHQHIYGLLFKILWPLCSGRPFSSETLSYPEDILNALQHKSTLLIISSPAHLKRLPDSLPWNNKSQAPCLVFSSGGALLKDDSLHAGKLLGITITEVYGSSETGGIAHRQQVSTTSDIPWTPLPGVEIMQSEKSELMIRSAHLEDDQWYTSADSAELLNNGTFKLGKRLDRITKIEGKRISLEKIEQLLQQLPSINEARVIALPGAREQLAAIATLTEQGQQQLAKGKRQLSLQLRDALAEHIERIAIPRKWRFVEEIPYNSLGKVTQALLLALFEK